MQAAAVTHVASTRQRFIVSFLPKVSSVSGGRRDRVDPSRESSGGAVCTKALGWVLPGCDSQTDLSTHSLYTPQSLSVPGHSQSISRSVLDSPDSATDFAKPATTRGTTTAQMPNWLLRFVVEPAGHAAPFPCIPVAQPRCPRPSIFSVAPSAAMLFIVVVEGMTVPGTTDGATITLGKGSPNFAPAVPEAASHMMNTAVVPL